MLRYLLTAATIGLLLWLAPPLHAPAAAEVRLPQMGEPADRALSPRDEARIGRNLMIHARRTLEIDRDPQVTAYLDELGQSLARHSGHEPIDGYTFFVIHDTDINALAAPGGYVGMYTGLIRQARNEAQLAGVLAHEIAHISQRHIARRIADQQAAAPASLAQVVAGILIGTVNPQAGQAAIMTGIGQQAQRQLDFTRDIEAEADRIGIRILARGGFDPEGMAEFFELLMRQELGAVDAAPEYLRTHPVSSRRLAEARNRAGELTDGEMRRDSLTFQLMRHRLMALEARAPRQQLERWQERGSGDDAEREIARQYGMALLELELNEPGAAAERIARLRSDNRDNLHLLLVAAEAARALDDPAEAEARYEQARDLHPASWPAALGHAELLRREGEAERAAGVLTRFLREHSGAPAELWREKARAQEDAGRKVASREALAEWYARSHRYDDAIRQLEMGLEQVDSGSNAEHRLQARLDEVRSRQRGRLASDPLTDGLRGLEVDTGPQRVLPDLDRPSQIPLER